MTEGGGEGQKQLVQSFSLVATAGLISFMRNQARAHRQGGRPGLDLPDSLGSCSEELANPAWSQLSVAKTTSPRLSFPASARPSLLRR